ncbi:MAG: MFS transporter [Acetobacteraceae bacterium]|nr:MFS transporter [Acetobacteraceae bacterium]
MELEKRTLSRVTLRLVPFLIVCYFIAYLDRVNVGFAALTMNKDLGLSQTAYGLGAGIFFFTYFLFEVPSNLFLARFGARKWIARIMITWGVLSGAMAFVQGEWSFYVVRCLLGAAEAGFFPGIIFYLTLWFPAAYRARILGYFMAAIPLSSVLGLPVSGALLGLDGAAGLHGWQWLFIIEAVPSVILSAVVYFYLTDRPADAAWLPADSRNWLMRRLAAEEQVRTRAQHFSLGQALFNGRVLALSLVYFGVVASLYGLSFFLPQIVKQFGVSTQQNAFISAVPFIVGTVATLVWGRLSDQTGNRKGMAAVALLLVAVGIGAAAWLNEPLLKMAAFCVAAFGIFGTLAVFWTLPTSFLSGVAAAGGIAVINSIGNLAGFAGPYAMGAIKDATNSYQGGLFLLAGLAFLAMLIVLALRHDRHLEQAPALSALAAE